MGRFWGRLSLRHQASVTLLVWALALSLLAIAAAIPAGPTASLSVDDPRPTVGQIVHFDASASAGHDQGRGRIVAYRFDFGDGTGTPDQALPTASHAYAVVGARSASVTVRDGRGNEGTATLTVAVQPKPPPTGQAPDLAPVAASTNPAQPTEGQLVSVLITIANRGGATAASATIDVSDDEPNGTTVRIGRTALPAPLEPGAFVDLYSPSFVAAGVGTHTLQIVVGNVSPPETDTGDNVIAIRMTVLASAGPPPPTGEGLSPNAAFLSAGLATAAVAALFAAAWLLRRPRRPGPLEPPPAEPEDQSPPPIRPP